jgi:hypothetical protein
MHKRPTVADWTWDEEDEDECAYYLRVDEYLFLFALRAPNSKSPELTVYKNNREYRFQTEHTRMRLDEGLEWATKRVISLLELEGYIFEPNNKS